MCDVTPKKIRNFFNYDDSADGKNGAGFSSMGENCSNGGSVFYPPDWWRAE